MSQRASPLEELRWRGLLYQQTETLGDALASGPVSAYCGFDPTASSLHVGNLVPVMGLAHLQRAGHRPIILVGGGTGMIGDPSGRTSERQLNTVDQVEANARSIRTQLERFLDFDGPASARVMNNAEWLLPLNAITFMRDVGKHFTVNYMLAKESVKSRIDEGISYTEFSYMLLQAYDYLELHRRAGATLQIGGSDQWGNITAGIDLIRKQRGKKAHGLVWPLMTTSSGVKFGKTEAGTIWLDPGRTSPFAFYQFWLNTDDRDVAAYLKYFTFLDRPHIDALEQATQSAPEKREAQRTLAREVTSLVHGTDQVARAEHASSLLFREDITALPVADVLAVFADVPSTALPLDELGADGIAIVDLVARVSLAPSKSEARRLVQSGGVYVNNRRITDLQQRIGRQEAIGGQLLLIRKGQKQNHLVLLT